MKIFKSLALVALGVALATLVASAQSQPRVFLVFTASVQPGHMSHYLGTVESQVLPIFKRLDVELIGVFNSGLGGNSNEVHILAAYKDMNHLQSTFQDAELLKIQAAEFEGIRVGNARTWTPVSFSPLK